MDRLTRNSENSWREQEAGVGRTPESERGLLLGPPTSKPGQDRSGQCLAQYQDVLPDKLTYKVTRHGHENGPGYYQRQKEIEPWCTSLVISTHLTDERRRIQHVSVVLNVKTCISVGHLLDCDCYVVA